EFLAALPVSRGQILTSKAALGILITLIAWGINVSVAALLGRLAAPALALDPPLPPLEGLVPLAAGSVLVFGAAWLGSSYLESPTFAVSLGIVAPLLVWTELGTAAYFGGWWYTQRELLTWYSLACAALGLLCFLAGT